MTKEEIYKYLKYNGVYDSGVKRRLKKLIKKYHPDLNNGDDTVMKVINEVKKELENNTVSIKNENDTKPTDIKNSSKSSVDIINITTLISKLNSEINSLNKKIEKGNHDEYKLFLEYNSSLCLYNTLKLNEKLINSKIIRLKCFRPIDKVNIFLMIISGLLTVYSIYFIIMLVSIIYLEVILFLIRYFKIKKYKQELRDINKMDKEYKSFSDNIKSKIDLLNKDLFGVKKDVRINKEKVRYYERMINDDGCSYSKDNIKHR